MADKYDHKKIESKWNDVWEKTKVNETDLASTEPKFYNLTMFPYPSADYLHIGHIYSYSGADVYGRYKRANGFNVFEPCGYDSFGLPAENYAIKKSTHPKKVIDKAIEHSRKQLKSSGFMFDYSREIITSEPSYYKWTQWLFLKLYEQGLAYQKDSPVNWCPHCMTVLANEQVVDGRCERCDAEVIQKEMKQWFFKTTEYADRLINDFDKVDWPESSVVKQKNWIGRSEGVEFEMDVADAGYKISVFTTRIDTVYGMTYVVLAPEHPLVSRITTEDQRQAVEDYREETQKQTDIERQSLEKEKTGVFTGSYAINPFNGEKVPIWIADYVLYGYGTGAVMAVPAHDERDFDFAKKYDLSIIQSIAPVVWGVGNAKFREGEKTITRPQVAVIVKHWAKDEYICLDWEKFGWKSFVIGGIDEGEKSEETAVREMREETGYQNVKSIRKIGGTIVNKYYAAHKGRNTIAPQDAYLIELEDGEQAKTEKEHTKFHKFEWVPKKNVQKYLTLENHIVAWEEVEEEHAFTGYGELVNSKEFDGLTSEEAKKKMAEWLEKKAIGKVKVNYRLHDWSFSRQRYWGDPIPIIYCEKCGVVPVPEKDLPVELPAKIKDFRPKGTGKGPLASVSEFVNTTCPKCGGKAERETDTMDTFVDSSFYFLRYPNVGNDKEMMEAGITKKWLPVDMYVGGAEHVTMHCLYARFITKALYDMKLIAFDEPFLKLRHQGMILGPDGKKMSKSKGNVINPDEVVKEHGADAFRTYILFMSRFEDGGPWNPKGIIGTKRFLEKAWKLFEFEIKNGEPDVEVVRTLNKTIKKVGEDIEDFSFNTAVSQLMILVNFLSSRKAQNKKSLEILCILLAPFAPYVTEELWEKLGNKDSVHVEKWPNYDPKLLEDEVVTVAVQVNGKVRDELVVDAKAQEKEVLELAQKSGKVDKYLSGKKIKKVIYIKGKLLSIVVG